MTQTRTNPVGVVIVIAAIAAAVYFKPWGDKEPGSSLTEPRSSSSREELNQLKHLQEIFAQAGLVLDGINFKAKIPLPVLKDALFRGLVEINNHRGKNCSGVLGCEDGHARAIIEITDEATGEVYLLVIHGVDDAAMFPNFCGVTIPVTHYNLSIHRQKRTQTNQTRNGKSYEVVFNLHISAELESLVVYESKTRFCMNVSSESGLRGKLRELMQLLGLEADLDLRQSIYDELFKMLTQAKAAGSGQ